MEMLFSDQRASAADQLEETQFLLPETADSFEGWMRIADGLARGWRYREAIMAYTKALRLEPESLNAYRKRAGKYLATLQPGPALRDFEACLRLGGSESELRYRMGLCHYYAGAYAEAVREFSRSLEVCDEELGIGAVYWSMIASWRSGRDTDWQKHYRDGMKVGHHTAYLFAVRTALGRIPLEEAARTVSSETDDLEFSLMAYGLAAIRRQNGEKTAAEELYREILRRDSFWISFGFLAAWNDRRQGRFA